MWNKIYFAAIGLSIAVMGFFSFYEWSWLQSKGNPADAIAGFEYHAGLSWLFLCISSVILLLLANAVIWANQKAWAIWATFVYFAVFVVIGYFWLGEAAFHFKKEKGMFDGSFSMGPFFAVILVGLSAVIAFFDQFLLVRLHRKTYPPIPPVDDASAPE